MPTGCLYKGPTRYQLRVLRLLLEQPASVPRLAGITGYPPRRVRGIITGLRAAGAVKKEREVKLSRARGGRWAVYAPVVIQI